MFQLKECIFWINVAHRISTFWTFHCLPEFFQIFHVIFETRSLEEGNDRGRGALPCILGVLLPIHIENSLSVYLSFEFQPQLGKTEEFNNQVVNENRTFRILFITKTQQKSRPLPGIFLKLQCKVYRGTLILYFNAPFF